MPKKPTYPPIVCQYFTWRLIRRDGVFYADGRSANHDLGKHSLGTREREYAIDQLKKLDRQKAIDLGLADATLPPAIDSTSIADGWRLFLDFSGRSDVQGGVSS